MFIIAMPPHWKTHLAEKRTRMSETSRTVPCHLVLPYLLSCSRIGWRRSPLGSFCLRKEPWARASAAHLHWMSEIKYQIQMTCIKSLCLFCLILKIPHWTGDSAPCLYILWQSLYRCFETPLCPHFCVPVVFLLGRVALEKNSSWMIEGPYNKNMWVVLNCTRSPVPFPSAVALLRRLPPSPIAHSQL